MRAGATTAPGREAARTAVRWLGRAGQAFLANARPGEPLALEEADEIERLAPAHALEPLLHSLLATGAIDRESVPERLRESWLAAYSFSLLTQQRRLSRVEGAFERCRERSLDLVALKGPAHVARVYGDPGLRPMADLDLLCRRSQLRDVAGELQAAGYELVRQSSTYHLQLRHQETGEAIELHFDLYELIARREQFLEELFRSAVAREVAGHMLRIPDPECCLVVDLAHLIQHDLQVGLRQVVDFAGQLHPARRRLDPVRLRRLLEAADLSRELSLVGGACERLLGLERGELETGEAAVSAVEPIVEQMVKVAVRLDEPAATPVLGELRVRPGLRAKALYLASLLAPREARRAAPRGGEIWRHLRGLVRSAGTKLVGRGAASARSTDSLKRAVYRRRSQGRRRRAP